MKHTITKIRAKEKTVIKISLDDDCKNGHEHFSLTADIYEQTPRGWREAGGGCCHEHILKLTPELAPFAAIHLSDQNGVPMHAIANAWYWFQGAFPESADLSPNLGPCHGGSGKYGKAPDECRSIFAEHIRATPEQVEAIVAANPRSQQELQLVLEELEFPQQWKGEALAAIQQLENYTGGTFTTTATRESWQPLTPEQVAVIKDRRESGYYLPEQVAARDAAAKQASKAKELEEIESEYAASVAKLDNDRLIDRFIVETLGTRRGANLIWYSHTNELAANWTSTDKLWTREAFDAFTAGAEMSKLPPGLKFRFQDKPKY